MIHQETLSNVIPILSTFVLIIFSVIFFAYQTCAFAIGNLSFEYLDPWETSQYERNLKDTKTYLKEHGHVSELVDDETFDYIVVLTSQLTTQFDNRVSTALALAVIAQESKFNPKCEFNGARGLMQLLPSYHEDRLIQFIEEDVPYSRDLFYDPRLNVASGVDYLNYILGETKGDLAFALMWYNQGAVSASYNYEERHTISHYAHSVMKLADKLDEILTKGILT